MTLQQLIAMTHRMITDINMQRLATLHPRIGDEAVVAMVEMRKMAARLTPGRIGDVMVTRGFETAAEQRERYGRVKDRGLSWEFVLVEDGKPVRCTNDHLVTKYRLIARCATERGWRWSGDKGKGWYRLEMPMGQYALHERFT